MLASQPEGLFCAITTAGSDHESVCRECHTRTKAINAGRLHQQDWYGLIYGADEKDDPHDEATWYKANPSLGTTAEYPLKLSSFRADYEAARAEPNQWPAFRQLRLNQWLTSVSGWFEDEDLGSFDLWDAGKDTRRGRRKRIDCFEDFDEDDVDGHRCWVGFDGSAVRDTTAAVFAFQDPDDPAIVRVLPYFWLPRTTAERYSKRVSYQDWSRAGEINLLEGDSIDYETVFLQLTELIQRFQPEAFLYDRLFQSAYLVQRLETATGIEATPFEQTIKYFSPVVKATEAAILEHQIRHNGHRVLSWQLQNAQMKTDPNHNKRPIRPKSHMKIDGVVAMLQALTGALSVEDEVGTYYLDNDLEYLGAN